MVFRPVCTLFLPIVCAGAGAWAGSPAPWQHPLSLGQGDPWTRRIALHIGNPTPDALEGRQLAVPVGSGPGQANLAGARVGELRLVDSAGTELLLAVTGPDGEVLEQGRVPEGGSLVVPVECPARSQTTLHLYFANPAAWDTPDFLPGAGSGEFNGGFEKGTKDLPSGWLAKDTDPAHRVSWDRKGGRDGGSAVRVVVDSGAEPSWVGVARVVTGIAAGGKYRVRGWVKASGVAGNCGWFIHAGHPRQTQLLNRTLGAGEGSFDWKEIVCEFTAPAGTTQVVVGTILHGSGTAWFDDASLERLDGGEPVTVHCGPVESLELQRRGGNSPVADKPGLDRAFEIRLANLSETPRDAVLVRVPLGGGNRRPAHDGEAGLTFEGRRLPFFLIGDSLLFEHRLPARTLDTCRFAFASARAGSAEGSGGKGELPGNAILPSDYATAGAVPAADREAYAKLLASPANLVRNPDFEQGATLPAAWQGTAAAKGDPAEYGVEAKGLFGQRSLRLHVPAEANKTWRGWRQRVPVQPGRTYLFAVWGRCEGLADGAACLHAHLLDASGKLVKENGYRSAGTPVTGDASWTLWEGTTLIPPDGAQLELHLTTEAKGTLWHDGAFVSEVVDAVAAPAGPRAAPGGGVQAWPVNPVVKVFREDGPPAQAPAKVRLSLARLEAEPLQLALRAGEKVEGVRVEAAAPAGPGGATLPLPDIQRVAYVPIDYPTNYYQSTTPVWHRKIPRAAPRCDGWAGWWPDPLLPNQPFTLEPGITQPLWLTFQAPAGAKPGLYRTAVRLRRGEEVLAEVPVELAVRPFALPADSSFAAIYDLRLARQWADRGESAAVRKSVMEFMKSRRLCPDRPEANPVFRREGGKIVADFAAYDEEAAFYFDTLKFPRAYTPPFFYLFGWGHPPKAVLGEPPYEGAYPFEGADRSQLRPEYRRVYQECLRLYWEHVKAKGWADRLVLYISDEPHFTHEPIRRQMAALCAMIHEVDSKIPIYSSTWRHCPDWNGSLDVWGVGHYGCFEVAEMERRKAAGQRIWFTTDGQMCTDTPYCAVERLLPHYSFRYGAEAYEFWGVGWLTYDPYRYGWHSYIHQSSEPGREFYVRYPNGDGYLLYPGKPLGIAGAVSSIRFEQAREGVEDYEYLQLLTRLAQAAPAHHPARTRAQRALADAAKLVEIPNAGGRYSSQILPDPDAVFRVREELAGAIEAFSGKE